MSTHNSVFMLKHLRFFGIGLLVMTGANLAIVPITTAWLEEATKKQCLAHAWPADKADIHIEWCEANNYPTEPRRYLNVYAIKALGSK